MLKRIANRKELLRKKRDKLLENKMRMQMGLPILEEFSIEEKQTQERLEKRKFESKYKRKKMYSPNLDWDQIDRDIVLKRRQERIEKENMRKSLEEIYEERDLDSMFKEGDF